MKYLLIIFLLLTPVLAIAADPDMGSLKPLPNPTVIKHGGIVPDCDPALPPSEPGACGVNKVIELLQRMIKYLSLVVIPIAILAIGWGGFQILTSAGSTEKVTAGRKAIITACTGIAIILVSYIVIQFVFYALGVTDQFKGSLFK